MTTTSSVTMKTLVLTMLFTWSTLLSASSFLDLSEGRKLMSDSAASSSSSSSPCEGELDSICGIHTGPNSYQEVYDARMCLWANRDQLSNICRTYIMEISPSIIEPCYDQIILYCKGVQPGENRIHNCLLTKDQESKEKDSSILPKECHIALEYDLKMNDMVHSQSIQDATNAANAAASDAVASSSSSSWASTASSLFAAATDALFSVSSASAGVSSASAPASQASTITIPLAVEPQRLNQRLISDLMEVMLFRNILTSLPPADASAAIAADEKPPLENDPDASSSSSEMDPSDAVATAADTEASTAALSQSTSYIESLITHLLKELTLLEGWMSHILPLSDSIMISSSPSLRGGDGVVFGDDDLQRDDDDYDMDDDDDDATYDEDDSSAVDGDDAVLLESVKDVQKALVDDDDQVLSRFSASAFAPDLVTPLSSSTDEEENQVLKDLRDAIAEVEKRWNTAPSKDDDGVEKKNHNKKHHKKDNKKSESEEEIESNKPAADYTESVSASTSAEDDDGAVKKVLDHAIEQLRESDALSSYPYYATAGDNSNSDVEGENSESDYFESEYLPNSEDGALLVDEEEEMMEEGEEKVSSGSSEEFTPTVSASSLFSSSSSSSNDFSPSVWTMLASAIQSVLSSSLSIVSSASLPPLPALPPSEEVAELSPSLRGSKVTWSEETD